jgi:hypothetical protein
MEERMRRRLGERGDSIFHRSPARNDKNGSSINKSTSAWACCLSRCDVSSSKCVVNLLLKAAVERMIFLWRDLACTNRQYSQRGARRYDAKAGGAPMWGMDTLVAFTPPAIGSAKLPTLLPGWKRAGCKSTLQRKVPSATAIPLAPAARRRNCATSLGVKLGR